MLDVDMETVVALFAADALEASTDWAEAAIPVEMIPVARALATARRESLREMLFIGVSLF